MEVNLVFGFLGSGKTTLVKRLLAEQRSGEKTAVIVNEFGEVGIDGEILRGRSIDMVELNSGCLCCTLRGSLMLAVDELRSKAKVDRIVVEATGVAQPGELLDTLADASLKQGFKVGPLVTVIDVAKFEKLDQMLGEFYEAQIENADILILNKIDLAEEGLRDEVRRDVAAINPAAEVMFAEQCDVDLGAVLGRDAVEAPPARGHVITPFRRSGMHQPVPLSGGTADHHGHLHNTPVEAFALGAEFETTTAALRGFFEGLASNVWRAKGFVRTDEGTVLIQFSSGQLDVSPAPARTRHELVFIGSRMDREAIESQFGQLQRH